MARPVRETPILKGENARRFVDNFVEIIENLENPEFKKNKALERQRMAKNYELLKRISVNPL